MCNSKNLSSGAPGATYSPSDKPSCRPSLDLSPLTPKPGRQASIPDLVFSPSAESDTDSTVSSKSPLPHSPRSIFKTYWSSPTAKKSVNFTPHNSTHHSTHNSTQDHLLDRLRSLQLPLDLSDHDIPPAPTKPQENPHRDLSFLCQPPKITPRSPPRRQILPNPPPSIPLQPRNSSDPCRRPWSSTSALLKKPHRSCLRRPRYSFNNTLQGQTSIDIRPPELRKSVSFYSQVSVLEFTVPQERRNDAWYKFFF